MFYIFLYITQILVDVSMKIKKYNDFTNENFKNFLSGVLIAVCLSSTSCKKSEIEPTPTTQDVKKSTIKIVFSGGSGKYTVSYTDAGDIITDTFYSGGSVTYKGGGIHVTVIDLSGMTMRLDVYRDDVLVDTKTGSAISYSY